MEEDIINELAKVGYESFFADRWDNLNPKSIEVALWKQVVGDILAKWNELHSGSAEVELNFDNVPNGTILA